jgi:maleylacetoacetate isomerase
MKLYTYYRSSAAFRVRIALNLKGLHYDSIPIHLVKDGGQQRHQGYLEKNPQGLVPMLQTEDEQNLSQSMAIIEYLEEVFPQPALLPESPVQRAQVRAISQAIACDIHPLNNLRVLQYLTNTLKQDVEQKNTWYRHWVKQGFAALEVTLSSSETTGRFCFGDTPGMADCLLIPQVYNAQRFAVNMADYPTIAGINESCLALDEFAQALPENQPDAE